MVVQKEQEYPTQSVIEGVKGSETGQYLNFLVLEKLENLSEELRGMHFYLLTITKTPKRTNYHLFSLDYMQEISRKLTNGLHSLGRVSNRKFWTKYFIGGIRTMSVSKDDLSEYPSFNMHYLVYSDHDNLDVRIDKNLSMRIKSIDRSLSYSFCYLGTYSKDTVEKGLPCFNEPHDEDEIYRKFGSELAEEVYKLPYQRPRYFGRLFKS